MRKKELMKGLSAALAVAMAMTNTPISLQAASTKLSVTKAVLSKGDKLDLNVIGDKEKSGKYTSSNKKTAKVTKLGVITAKKAGKATITWKNGKKKHTCSITVVKAPKVSAANVTVSVGESADKVTVNKQGNKNLTVKWVSANTEIAEVKKGVITGISEGETSITAKIKGNSKTYKKTIKVTVTRQESNGDSENNGQENNGQTPEVTESLTKTITAAGNLEEGVYETVTVTSNVGAGGVVSLGKSKIGKLILESGEEYNVDASQTEISDIEVVQKLAVTASAKRIAKTPTLIIGNNKNAETMNIVVNAGCYISGTAQINSITVRSTSSVYIETPVQTVNVEASNANISLNGDVGDLTVSGENANLSVNGEVKKAVVSGDGNNIIVNSKATLGEVVIAAEKTTIEGNGTIKELTIEAGETIVKTAVEKATVSEKAGSAEIGGNKVESGKTVENVAAVAGQTDKEAVETVDDTAGTQPSGNGNSGNTGSTTTPGGSTGGTTTPSTPSQPSTPSTPNEPSDTPEDPKEESDVATLQELIAEQKELGATVDEDLNSKQYSWDKENHLISIDWSQSNLQGDISFSAFKNLTSLNCDHNNLASLDVSGATALTDLSCRSNDLKVLDTSSNDALTSLICSENNLTSLKVSGNVALFYLHCSNNNLTELDISRNTALTGLNCSDNDLTELIISQNTTLTYLYCSNNKLTALETSNNTTLTTLSCEHNRLTVLDLTNNKKLDYLFADRNIEIKGYEGFETYPPTSSDPTNPNPNPKEESEEAALQKLIAEQRALGATISENLDSLQYEWNEEGYLISIDWSGKGLQGDISFSAFKNLTSLNCSHNRLTALDVSDNIALTDLNCEENRLTTLNVSGSIALTSLRCYTILANEKYFRYQAALSP